MITSNGLRNIKIDTIRGVAIYLVVIGHFLQCYSHTASQYVSNKLYLIIYAFHMPLFMFISGVLYKRVLFRGGNRSLIINGKKRTAQLLYPYVLWGVIAIILQFCSYYVIDHTSNEIGNIVKKTLEAFSPYWFLFSLWVSSLIALIVSHYCKTEKISKVVLICIAFIWYLLGIRDRDIWMNVFFVAGILLSDYFFSYIDNMKIKAYQTIVLLIVITSLFLFLCKGLTESDLTYKSGFTQLIRLGTIGSTLVYAIRAFLGIGCVVTLVKVLCEVGRLASNKTFLLLVDAGKITLPIYIVQKCFVEILGVFLVKLLGSYYPVLFTNNLFVYSVFCVAIGSVSFLALYKISKYLNANPLLRKYLFGVFF